ncbi:hypothetical protein EI981_05730 [Paenibacillus lutimineralis]|uniref:Uncharacterized protein n=1 Tax=Paenibacillus lutimineralis TaxID=2707005 RepID=A0A3S9UUI1_9BACL|nr:hypothetical protein EI981_05730 [Paenibacillus lutimineralis]
MTHSEFIQLVKCGMEYNFYVKDEEYWISSNENGYYLTRVRDSSSQEFKTPEELLENGRINGLSLFDLWDDLKDFFQ